MRFWDKSLRIFNCLCKHGKQSVRRIAQKTGCSQRSVHRLTQAMERRGRHPASWLWETEEGHRWLTRLVIATLYPFGFTRGVGADTLSAFFARLRLEMQVGCAPSALRGVMEALVVTIEETAQVWEQDGVASGEGREMIGAVDATCLEQMILVFQDVPTGDIVQEEVADDRPYSTWKALVDERLKALGTSVLSLVSDRAKALMQLAEQGFECLSMPDCFHFMPDIVKSYSRTIARQLRQAPQARTHAEAVLARHPELAHGDPDRRAVKAEVQAKRAEGQRWEEVQRMDRHHLETLSLTRHPCGISDAAPQTSAQVQGRLQAAGEAIAALAERPQLPHRHDAMQKGRTPLPALAALVDFWWEGVGQALEPRDLSPLGRRGAREGLLPLVSWAHQAAHTRWARRKAKRLRLLEAVRAAFHQHAITRRMPPQVLEEWQGWATQRVQALQRASSAVEGRNGYLSHRHHHHRGLPKQRYKVWTALHTFDGRAADGTTPASRFFRRTFPDLFETMLSHIDDLPRPRQRNQVMALTG